MAQRKLKKIEKENKKPRILAAFEAGGDWQTLAENLGVSKSTVYRWVSTENTPDKRRGLRREKFSEVHRNFLAEEIENNPRITLPAKKLFTHQI